MNHLQSNPASAVNDRQSRTVGPGKIFNNKKLTSLLKKMNSNIVMGPAGKMVITNRATNAPLTKLG